MNLFEGVRSLEPQSFRQQCLDVTVNGGMRQHCYHEDMLGLTVPNAWKMVHLPISNVLKRVVFIDHDDYEGRIHSLKHL